MQQAIAIKEDILSRSNERKRKTVEALWNVLLELRAKGVKSFSVAVVGKACEDARVLKTQSIRNTSGADFRNLIAAFAVDGDDALSSRGRQARSPLDEAVDAIPDLDVRTRLRIMVAENRKQRDEINRLKEAFKHLREPAIAPSAEGAIELFPPASPSFRDIDFVPLRKFLSADWLDDNHWHIEANGAIYDADGNRVTPVAFVPALSALIALIDNHDKP
ncbi:hypothetical protein FHW79_006466 [Azospirillum sp. OGB3]|uniref:gamma-mobile-trio protein GmtX n=1 Tax=Azospirillum sp. OGB3 TaxID=2587012 RepID=UPI0016063751|nr:gamma-mobile-trio protein GmtX [Azospirillum sp. OGB3]MBB3268790.1 hypothetical protein [Azospirillum sp. OGB3]